MGGFSGAWERVHEARYNEPTIPTMGDQCIKVGGGGGGDMWPGIRDEIQVRATKCAALERERRLQRDGEKDAGGSAELRTRPKLGEARKRSFKRRVIVSETSCFRPCGPTGR